MSRRLVRVLHVEDDPFQHRLLAHLLEEMIDFDFKIAAAVSEKEGLALFEKKGADLIVLDYQLIEGNGLHFLTELRRHDPHVPVIAVCGKAGPEIARELIECGADDFLDKKDLTRQKIETSVREVLTRWDAWRRPEFHARLDTVKT